ncbi:MAG: tetratricopeptide repeat protein [Lewinellaceae bacterium]|nr:tetratricopeptide repeat protein [Phaeodactylibacter sp.]MCB9038995.1 tetratricopeptide repeat protein [Lewinellaceae bacterium]
MRNSLYYLFLLCLLPLLATSQQDKEDLLYIEWAGEDELANELAWRGMGHFMNIEREKAYTFFEAAVAQDPSLFAPHVVLAWMSEGDKKARHTAEAKRLVEGKNEPSRLFVSLLDVPEGKDAPAKYRAIWKKMHEVAPDGAFIHFQYALSMDDPKAEIAELEKLAEKLMAEEKRYAHIHNILGYQYYNIGDKEKAKMHFEKYIELYPDGYNPYDSMGEFYLNEGDLETALSYYKKARENYPPAVSARNKIEDIEAQMDEEGNLILVLTEFVHPEHIKEYVQWGKEYKAIADKTNFSTFWVNSENGGFSYAQNVGKSMSGVDDFGKEWNEWSKANPEINELYEKYKHTLSRTERTLWRHSPEFSYEPEGYESNSPPTYVRSYHGYVKAGSEKAVGDLLAEFKAEWEKHKIAQPYSVYWNVFGKEQTCVSIRTAYKDREAWLAERKEVGEKVGEEKLNDLMSRWNKHMRKWEEHESFPHSDLTHIQNEIR